MLLTADKHNKIMKTLQRQFMFQPQHKQPNCKKQQKCDQFKRNTHRSHLSIQETTAKRMLNFNHRRKYQLPEYKLSIIEKQPIKSQQTDSKYRICERDSKVDKLIRHTYYATDLLQCRQQQFFKGEVELKKEVKKQRIKDGPAIYKTLYPQDFKKTMFGWKTKESNMKTQEKTEKTQSEEHNSRTIKKSTNFNQTAYSFNSNSDKGQFLYLIDKFKFQNLKTADKVDKTFCSPTYFRQASREQKRPQPQFMQGRKTVTCNFTPKQADKKKKLIPLLQSSQTKDSKVIRKLSFLSPWQLSQAQLGGTAEMLLHS